MSAVSGLAIVMHPQERGRGNVDHNQKLYSQSNATEEACREVLTINTADTAIPSLLRLSFHRSDQLTVYEVFLHEGIDNDNRQDGQH